MYSVIVNNKKGYAAHPETMRWRTNLPELILIHEQTAAEMVNRGFDHKSPMSGRIAQIRSSYGIVDPIRRQIYEIYMKGCQCDTTAMTQWYTTTGHKLELNKGGTI